MASFRAITGQEEAAAALIKALQLRDYPGAGKINVRSHQHKAALLLFIKAVERALSAGFGELQATLDASKPRIDVKVRIPRDRGHEFHGKVGTNSTRWWARIPRDRGRPLI